MRRLLTRCLVPILALSLLMTLVPGVKATSMVARNVVDLIELSQRIVVGEVTSLSDGFDANNVPYTEITLRVEESILGVATDEYSFRQFGLLQPRELPGGRTYLGVSPDGWPHFSLGEKVMVFLYKKAQGTGLQTTVGLLQGKFTIQDGRLSNAVGNRHLFKDVAMQAGMAQSDLAAMLAHDGGPLDATRFISFVRTAVKERWIEERRVYHAQ